MENTTSELMFNVLAEELERISKSTTREEAFNHWDRFWSIMRGIRINDGKQDFTSEERVQFILGMSKAIPAAYHSLVKNGLVEERFRNRNH